MEFILPDERFKKNTLSLSIDTFGASGIIQVSGWYLCVHVFALMWARHVTCVHLVKWHHWQICIVNLYNVNPSCVSSV